MPESNDLSMCELRVLVKFRTEERLHVLDPNRQSGGERSVSTIAFLNALQGVTKTPFRIVDEINQGMDAVNERKIYNLLVASASEPTTPQCFLLTPKLLPSLPFNEMVTIINIMNGPHIERVRMQPFHGFHVSLWHGAREPAVRSGGEGEEGRKEWGHGTMVEA